MNPKHAAAGQAGKAIYWSITTATRLNSNVHCRRPAQSKHVLYNPSSRTGQCSGSMGAQTVPNMWLKRYYKLLWQCLQTSPSKENSPCDLSMATQLTEEGVQLVSSVLMLQTPTDWPETEGETICTHSPKSNKIQHPYDNATRYYISCYSLWHLAYG